MSFYIQISDEEMSEEIVYGSEGYDAALADGSLTDETRAFADFGVGAPWPTSLTPPRQSAATRCRQGGREGITCNALPSAAANAVCASGVLESMRIAVSAMVPPIHAAACACRADKQTTDPLPSMRELLPRCCRAVAERWRLRACVVGCLRCSGLGGAPRRVDAVG